MPSEDRTMRRGDAGTRSDEVLESRRRLETSLQAVRDGLGGEIGWVPRRGLWSVLLLAGAVGLTLGLTLGVRKLSRRAPED